ncbi:hypothetical protein OOZ54_12770 [Rhodopseudomonas palustris]|uniref:hypothetical protein n=1 Tax=Rhodopseudomonas palustris TaxID=1076 RepID=UPI0022F00E36|nr:hypothetical protein [Rhodopseudomonas palustris]WBU27567.1 hypothetical protein OOZ54_12770 [Rhodopseudomonas palustris]
MKRTPPTFAELCDAVARRTPPTTQAEWRAASRAIREARRASGGRIGRTIILPCGTSHRYIYAEASFGGMRCYNGPGYLAAVDMIAHHRRRLQEGCRASRVEFARQFAAAARRDGRVPLP